MLSSSKAAAAVRRMNRVSVAGIAILLLLAATTVAVGRSVMDRHTSKVGARTAGQICDLGLGDLCLEVLGPGMGMAVPLMQPWLRGDGDGATHFTICCWSVNPNNRVRVSGSLNGQAIAVNSGGSSDQASVDGHGYATLVYGVSGTTYHYRAYRSSVSVSFDSFDPPLVRWGVSGDIFTYVCAQKGASRVPSTDCGNGTQVHAGGTASFATAPGTNVTVPISYWTRTVDFKQRPLTTPTNLHSGHWTLAATKSYHGYLWTVEWNVSSVASARIAGSVFVANNPAVNTGNLITSIGANTRVTVTDGPFN